MLTDGLELLGSSTASNFSIEVGDTFPTQTTAGELFFKTGLGLHVYDGTDWIQVGKNVDLTSSAVTTALGFTPAALVNGVLDVTQIPAIAITDTFVVATEAAMLALTAQVGDIAVRTDLHKSFILKAAGAAALVNWQELLTPTDAVSSVNGLTGVITLTSSNIAEGTNQYFTPARARSSISVTGNGSSYDSSTGIITIAAGGAVSSVNGQTGVITLSSTDIAEGNNKYYTDARARAAISVSGTGSSYNATTGVITIASGAAVAGTDGQVQYNASGVLSASAKFNWTDSSSTLALGGTGSASLASGAALTVIPGTGSSLFLTGGATADTTVAGNVVLSGGTSVGGTGGYIQLRTSPSANAAYVDRLVILSNGEWRVNGVTGTSGQALLSGGAGGVPTWGTPAAGAVAANVLTGTTLATNVVTASLSTLATNALTISSTSNAATTVTLGTIATLTQSVIQTADGVVTASGNANGLLVRASHNTGGPTNGQGGALQLRGGNSATGTTSASGGGGAVQIIGGDSVGGNNGTGGSVYLVGGTAGTNSNAGNIYLTGGVAGTGSSQGTVVINTNSTVRLTFMASGAWGLTNTLSTGTTGQVLTSQGTAAAPIWATPAAGGGAASTLTGTDLATNVVNSSLSAINSGTLKVAPTVAGTTAITLGLAQASSTSATPTTMLNSITAAAGTTGLTIQGPDKLGGGTAGPVTIKGGTTDLATSAGVAGGVAIQAGNSSATSGAAVTINGGNAGTIGGNVVITTGTGSQQGGVILFYTPTTTTPTLRMTIRETGALSFGATQTATGTAGQVLTSAGSTAPPAWSVIPYDLAGACIGKPTASTAIMRFVAVRPFILPVSLAGTVGSSSSAPTASTQYPIQKNGTQVGVMIFGTTGAATFSFSTAQTFAIGDVLTVVAPAVLDATHANFQFTFVATLA